MDMAIIIAFKKGVKGRAVTSGRKGKQVCRIKGIRG